MDGNSAFVICNVSVTCYLRLGSTFNFQDQNDIGKSLRKLINFSTIRSEIDMIWISLTHKKYLSWKRHSSRNPLLHHNYCKIIILVDQNMNFDT